MKRKFGRIFGSVKIVQRCAVLLRTRGMGEMELRHGDDDAAFRWENAPFDAGIHQCPIPSCNETTAWNTLTGPAALAALCGQHPVVL